MSKTILYKELEALPVGIYRIQIQEGYDLHYLGAPDASMVDDLAAQAQVCITDRDVGVRDIFVTKDTPVKKETAPYAVQVWLLDSFRSHHFEWMWCEGDKMYMLVVLPTAEGDKA